MIKGGGDRCARLVCLCSSKTKRKGYKLGVVGVGGGSIWKALKILHLVKDTFQKNRWSRVRGELGTKHST